MFFVIAERPNNYVSVDVTPPPQHPLGKQPSVRQFIHYLHIDYDIVKAFHFLPLLYKKTKNIQVRLSENANGSVK